MNKQRAGKQYQQINAQTGVMDADPHKLIQMLYTGALDSIARARGCVERGDLAGKGEAISKAIAIVGGLSDSINVDVPAPELTGNLDSLYEFVTNALTQANVEGSVEPLDQAAAVLKELQAGWDGIRAEVLSSAEKPQPA